MLFNVFFVYRTLNTDKVKYKHFLHELGRSWKSEVQNLNDLWLPEKGAETGPARQTVR